MELLKPAEIVRLSPSERIALIAQLWDSLDDDQLSITGAQQWQLEIRPASLEEDRQCGMTWTALLAEFIAACFHSSRHPLQWRKPT